MVENWIGKNNHLQLQPISQLTNIDVQPNYKIAETLSVCNICQTSFEKKLNWQHILKLMKEVLIWNINVMYPVRNFPEKMFLLDIKYCTIRRRHLTVTLVTKHFRGKTS